MSKIKFIGDTSMRPKITLIGTLPKIRGVKKCYKLWKNKNTKMKVLILATGYPRWEGDFANIYLHRLAKSLVNKGVEVHVIAPHARGLKREEIINDVYIHRFQYLYPSALQNLAYFPGIPEKIKTVKGKLQLPFFMISMIKKMLEIVKKYEIDVINAHWAIPTGFIATVTKKIHKKPVLITLYGAELWPAIKKNSKIMKWLIKYALNNADKVVGISDATCSTGKEISGRKDIEILPDGIDIETFNPRVNGNEIGKKYGRFIFSSGRMVERKGFIYLVRAMPYILKKFPQIKLIIGGNGPEKEKLENEVKKLNIENNVIFPGFISDNDFPKYMKACDVFVLPSIVDSKGDTEGSATILLESMACGTTVVGTKVGGVPYAIKDGKGGFLVEQKNPKELAEQIIMLLEDEKLRKKMGKVGRRYVEEKFSWEKIAEKYIEKFEMIGNMIPMEKQKKYWELTSKGIMNFYNSLNKEKETFRLSLEDLLKSEIIIKEESNDKLAGIAGIRKHKMLPVLFIVVKSEFQGKGIGKKLIQRLHQIAKRKYSLIVLSVIKENKQAINLFKKFGYKVFGEKKGFYYMVYPINLKGEIITKIHIK